MNYFLLTDLKKLWLCLLLVFTSIAGAWAQCDEAPVFSASATEIERSCSLFERADFTALATDVSRCYRVDAATGTVVSGSLDPSLEAALSAGGELPIATSLCEGEVEICLAGTTVPPANSCTDTARLSRTFTARNTAPEASAAPASFAQNILFVRPLLASVTGVENVVFYFPDNGNGMPENPAPRPEDYPVTQEGLHLLAGFCGYSVTFQDGERDGGCGNNFTFVRTFGVTNDCDGDSRVFSQIVRVGDQQTTVESPPSLAQNPLFFGTNLGCAAVVDTRLTGLTIADICDGSSRLDAYVYLNGQLADTPLGPYSVFSPNEQRNFTDPVPIGRHIIRYLGQDSYGAQTILDIDFEVGDDNRPAAICRPGLTVELDENTTVVLSAEDFDQGSADDCSGVTFSVARSGEVSFQDRLVINCDDFGRVSATLRVTDATGNNSAECSVELTVTDSQRPTCAAPPSTSITCQTFASNLPVNLREVFNADPAGTASLLNATFGTATGIDNCDSLRMREFLTGGLSECGNGRFTRSFVVNDQTGFTQVDLCQQFITVRPYTEYSLRLPGDENYDSCLDIPAPEDLVVGGAGCDLLTVSTETDTLADDGSACYQLRLTHTFINWCEYDGGSDPINIPRDADNDGNLRPTFYLNIDPVGDEVLTDDRAMLDRDVVSNNGNEIGTLVDTYGNSLQRGHFRYVQLVTVTDNFAPQLDLPTPDNGQTITADCLGGILLNFKATDDCAAPQTLVTLDIDMVDRNGDDTISRPDFLEDRQVSPNRFTVLPDNSVEINIRFLPIGQHLARVRTTDDCGNLTEQFVVLTVEDARAPRPDCSAVNNVALTPDPAFGGIAVLQAADFIRGPATVCTEIAITYALYLEETAAQVGFVPQVGGEQVEFDCSDLGQNLLRVYAIAEATGRHDYCNISVDVSSTNDICAGRLGIVDGYILTEAGAPMAGVEVFAVTDGQEIGIMTEDDGYYRFDGLAEGAEYTIRPYHDDEPSNGLSTFDISLISAYLTENQEEDLSPYQLIAADANNSRAITILDLIEIREILLGIDDRFDNNTSWRFVPADYAFPDATNPWAEQFPEVATIMELSGTHSVDFVAVKVGDVNNSATPLGSLLPSSGSIVGRNNETVSLELQHSKNDTWSLVIAGHVPLSGVQFSVALPAGAKIVGGTGEDYWAIDNNEVLHFSYVPEDGRYVFPEEELLELKLPNGTQLAFAEDRLAPEAYTNNGRTFGLELTIAGRLFDQTIRVFPNPITSASMLSFAWPVREALRLELIDASGRLVAEREVVATAGENSLSLGLAQAGLRSGIYFVRLTGREGEMVARLVR